MVRGRKTHTGLSFGLLFLGLLRSLWSGLIRKLLKFGMESFGSGIHDWTEEVLAQSGSVALGNAGSNTFRHCERKGRSTHDHRCRTKVSNEVTKMQVKDKKD
jgi:hypothetical protein